jgi:Fe-Mn family superoxide dismutase
MKFELAPLPYRKDALEPHIGRRTLEFHYEKHHRGYIDKLNRALTERPNGANDRRTLVDLIRGEEGKVFNLAAQAWNHDFYWRSMSPEGGGRPEGRLAAAIERDYGSFDELRKRLITAATGQFGSGWAWLACDHGGKLRVLSTHDAGNPITDDLVPLLTIDVWEHAYYLDYQNERKRYVESCLDHLVDWSFATQNHADVVATIRRQSGDAAAAHHA